jgi:ABC-type uncharacterized transport system substrate-binding protein
MWSLAAALQASRISFYGALREVVTARMDALYVVSSRLTLSGLNKLVPFAMEHRLPLAGGWGAWAKSGGLLSYGPNLGVMMQHSASYVDRILKGARPSDLPIAPPPPFATRVPPIPASIR